MTRYARAKGSKASNDRIPERATPWQELKSGVNQKKKNKECEEKNLEQPSKSEEPTKPKWTDLTGNEKVTKRVNPDSVAKKEVGKKRKRDNSDFTSRRPNFKVIKIADDDVTIVPFDGFYIKEDDAERLKKLRFDMVKQGIPKSEINATIKLERRKAEKALSRCKKKVCFHCRKFGHNLSSCPELNESSDMGSGICYKCGSTEHSRFDCKVIQGENYRFASCFICKEQGHIARQCPDNPRGLYPHGGGCKLCGDVTHLKQDCPQLITKKEEEVLTLNVSKNTKIEALEEDAPKVQKAKTKKKKIVKF